MPVWSLVLLAQSAPQASRDSSFRRNCRHSHFNVSEFEMWNPIRAPSFCTETPPRARCVKPLGRRVGGSGLAGNEPLMPRVCGAKFFDHACGRGGGGAIDLVMHARGCGFREALAFLADGPPLAPAAPLPATGTTALRLPGPVAEH